MWVLHFVLHTQQEEPFYCDKGTVELSKNQHVYIYKVEASKGYTYLAHRPWPGRARMTEVSREPTALAGGALGPPLLAREVSDGTSAWSRPWSRSGALPYSSTFPARKFSNGTMKNIGKVSIVRSPSLLSSNYSELIVFTEVQKPQPI